MMLCGHHQVLEVASQLAIMATSSHRHVHIKSAVQIVNCTSSVVLLHCTVTCLYVCVSERSSDLWRSRKLLQPATNGGHPPPRRRPLLSVGSSRRARAFRVGPPPTLQPRHRHTTPPQHSLLTIAGRGCIAIRRWWGRWSLCNQKARRHRRTMFIQTFQHTFLFRNCSGLRPIIFINQPTAHVRMEENGVESPGLTLVVAPGEEWFADAVGLEAQNEMH